MECLFCHRPLGPSMAGWTGRRLAEPVAAAGPYAGATATPAGWYALCPGCTAWMRQRARNVAPVGLLKQIRLVCGRLDPETASEFRPLLVAHARTIADALGPPVPLGQAMDRVLAEKKEAQP